MSRDKRRADGPPSDHVSLVVEREHQPGQLPRFRSTVTVVDAGKVTEHRTEWLPIERFVAALAVHRGLERDALMRWLGSGGATR